jgi:hypothetical protein
MVRNWIDKAAAGYEVDTPEKSSGEGRKKIPGMPELKIKSLEASENGIAVRYTLNETLAIIRAGGKNTLADLLADNAQKSAAPAVPPRPSRYPFFDRADCAAVLAELRQCYAANLLSRDAFNNIVLCGIPATVLRRVPSSSALDQFVQSNLRFISGAYEKTADVHERYLACGGLADMSRSRFTRYLKANYSDITVKQKKMEGYPVQVYQNVRLTPAPVAIMATPTTPLGLPGPKEEDPSMNDKITSTFTFNGQPLRIIDKQGTRWFRAMDVFCALELKDPFREVEKLGNGETTTFDAFGLYVSASGLEKLASKSYKPEAGDFKAWVKAEVLSAQKSVHAL